jgi:hypothetical protein
MVGGLGFGGFAPRHGATVWISNLAYIGSDFTTERTETFDRHYMHSLYDYGYQQGRREYRRPLDSPNPG